MRRVANELTEKERRFCEVYVFGTGTARNRSASVRAAGYSTKYPADLGRRILVRPLVQQEIAKLRLVRAATGRQQCKQWEDLLPEGQDLQVATIQAAQEILERKVQDPEAQWTGPEVGLVKVGVEAARSIIEYAVGKPVRRTEQGAPGDFRRLSMDEAIADLRDHLAALEALGVLRLPPGTAFQLGPGKGLSTLQKTAEGEDLADDEPEQDGG